MTERLSLSKIREHQSRSEDHRKTRNAHCKVDIILLFAPQHLEAGASVAAAIAAALHSHGQLVGAAESRDEQRHQHRDQRLDALGHLAVVQLRTTGFLGVHDLVGLLDEGRNEPQRDAHHHGQFMHREVEPAKRLEQLLDGVRQNDGTGGVGQKARACDEGHDAHRHQYSIPDALRVNGQKSELEHRVALARDKEEVQHRRKDDDGEDGLQALEDELENLKVVKRKEVAGKIKEAREQGDLSENAEYDAAKDEQRDIEARIEELEGILKNAEVVVEDEVDLDKINVGCTVKVFDVTFDEEMEFKIVGSTEANSLEGKISNESPVGQALLGKKAGDLVDVETQAGQIQYKVLEISRSM